MGDEVDGCVRRWVASKKFRRSGLVVLREFELLDSTNRVIGIV